MLHYCSILNQGITVCVEGGGKGKEGKEGEEKERDR